MGLPPPGEGLLVPSERDGTALLSTGLPLPQHASSGLVEGRKGQVGCILRSLVLAHPGSLIPGLAPSLRDPFGEFP